MNKYFDVDKSGIGDNFITNNGISDNSCWKATAANMLAAAGYNPRLIYPNVFIDRRKTGHGEYENQGYDIYNLLLHNETLHINRAYNSGWIEDASISNKAGK